MEDEFQVQLYVVVWYYYNVCLTDTPVYNYCKSEGGEDSSQGGGGGGGGGKIPPLPLPRKKPDMAQLHVHAVAS